MRPRHAGPGRPLSNSCQPDPSGRGGRHGPMSGLDRDRRVLLACLRLAISSHGDGAPSRRPALTACPWIDCWTDGHGRYKLACAPGAACTRERIGVRSQPRTGINHRCNELTLNATLASLVASSRLVPYEPRLRWDQNPGGLSYLCPDCWRKVCELPAAPHGENPDPLPDEQIRALLDRFALGEDLLPGHDYDGRGKGLFILRTRSVRMAGGFLSKEVFVGVDLCLRGDLNPAKGGTMTSAAWYRRTRAHPLFTSLSSLFLQGGSLHA